LSLILDGQGGCSLPRLVKPTSGFLADLHAIDCIPSLEQANVYVTSPCIVGFLKGSVCSLLGHRFLTFVGSDGQQSAGEVARELARASSSGAFHDDHAHLHIALHLTMPPLDAFV
jgi:hypothetical protein